MAAVQRFKIILSIATLSTMLFLALAMLPITTYARAAKQEPTLSLDEARQFVLQLINKDRKANGQMPVVLDAIATISGQQHSNDMAENGYLSHWDFLGTKPDQRYTRAGGEDAVAENGYILSYTDSPQQQSLSQPQTFAKDELEGAERTFMDEVPPDDGHRKNILDPYHTGVGIGISVSGDERNRRLAITQEFVDDYGSFSPLPERVRAGDNFIVGGKVKRGVNLYSVDVRWEQLPSPMTLKQLKETYSYGPPVDRVATLWPAHPRRPGILITPVGDGVEFSANVNTNNWRPGLYYVFVWATKDGTDKPFVISRRTVELR